MSHWTCISCLADGLGAASQTTDFCGDVDCHMHRSSGITGKVRNRTKTAWFEAAPAAAVVKDAAAAVLHVAGVRKVQKTKARVPKVATVRVQALARPALPGEELLELAKLVPEKNIFYWALVDALVEPAPAEEALAKEALAEELHEVEVSEELAAFSQSSLEEVLAQLVDEL